MAGSGDSLGVEGRADLPASAIGRRRWVGSSSSFLIGLHLFAGVERGPFFAEAVGAIATPLGGRARTFRVAGHGRRFSSAPACVSASGRDLGPGRAPRGSAPRRWRTSSPYPRNERSSGLRYPVAAADLNAGIAVRFWSTRGAVTTQAMVWRHNRRQRAPFRRLFDEHYDYVWSSAFNQVGIGGAPASLLPIDGIQEFNLQSNFSAEYGRNSGSIVNIISRSGTNQFHGSGFEFLRNDAMDARNFFNRDTIRLRASRTTKARFETTISERRLAARSLKTKHFSLARMKDSVSESLRTSRCWCRRNSRFSTRNSWSSTTA